MTSDMKWVSVSIITLLILEENKKVVIPVKELPEVFFEKRCS